MLRELILCKLHATLNAEEVYCGSLIKMTFMMEAEMKEDTRGEKRDFGVVFTDEISSDMSSMIVDNFII